MAQGKQKFQSGKRVFAQLFSELYTICIEKCKILEVGQASVFGYVKPNQSPTEYCIESMHDLVGHCDVIMILVALNIHKEDKCEFKWFWYIAHFFNIVYKQDRR